MFNLSHGLMFKIVIIVQSIYLSCFALRLGAKYMMHTSEPPFTLFSSYRRESSSTNQCPPIGIDNGYVRINKQNARFRCDKNYTLIGSSVIQCYGNEWSGDLPVCAAPGCSTLQPPKQGSIKQIRRKLYVTVNCNPGYSIDGSSLVYCDGHYWNASSTTLANICKKSMANPPKSCDFEQHNQCGWISDDPDRVVLMDHELFRFYTNGVAVDKSFTTDSTHILVIWRSLFLYHHDQVNRLYSPVYESKESETCLTFRYTLSDQLALLRATSDKSSPPPIIVYIKQESIPFANVTPYEFEINNDNYDNWRSGHVYIPKLNQDWQVILEFNTSNRMYGIDDISLDHNVTKCANRSQTTGFVNNWVSCKGRCSTTLTAEVKGSCSCVIYCSIMQNCCPDYELFCVTNSTRDDDFGISDGLYYSDIPTQTIQLSNSDSKTTLKPLLDPVSSPRSRTANQSIIHFPTETTDGKSKTFPTISTSISLGQSNLTITSKPTQLPNNSKTPSVLSNETSQFSTPPKVRPISQIDSMNSTQSTVEMNVSMNVTDGLDKRGRLITSTMATINLTMSHLVSVNTSYFTTKASGIILANASIGKAEASIAPTSNMRSICILIGVFMFVSLIGTLILWKRHKKFLGSSLSADSELRYLTQEADD